MGFESFRVEIRGGRAKHADLKATVRNLPCVQLDPDSPPLPGSTFYILADGRHVLEIELSDAPVRLSCRFTLCHPASVDSVLLGFVRTVMTSLGMQAYICDDVRQDQARSFAIDDFAEFSSLALRTIGQRRAAWIAAFGNDQAPATTNEVHARIILPRCQPLEQPH